MKRFICAGFTTLVLSTAIIASVKADPTALNPYNSSRNTPVNITPFELVNLAREGQFQAQGIPSYGAFTTSYALGHLTAQDLIQAAIQTNRLPADIVDDNSYLSNVTTELKGINNIH